MSYELVAKIAYNTTEETLTMFTCSNNVTPKSYNYGFTITKEQLKNIPEYCNTTYSQFMFAVFRDLLKGNIVFNNSVSAKFKNAATALLIAEYTNPEFTERQYFNIFLDILTGVTGVTKGKFVVVAKGGYYYKTQNKYTLDISMARVFTTKEAAQAIALNGGNEVEEIV